MSTVQFASRFERYLADARGARARDLHHDQRRELFLTFLHDAFGIDTNADVQREQYIPLAGQRM